MLYGQTLQNAYSILIGKFLAFCYSMGGIPRSKNIIIEGAIYLPGFREGEA